MNTWHDLKRLAHSPINLQHYFTADSNRGQKFSATACDIYMDFSKQAIDDESLLKLIQLADACELSQKIKALLAGEKVNDTEQRAALHTALRLPKGEPLIVDGVDVGQQVHDSLDKCEALVHRIRSGIWRGYS